MIDLSLELLAEEWLAAKAAEGLATDARRAVEDRITDIFNPPVNAEGTSNLKLGVYQCQLVHKITRKVDSEMLSVIAAEHGIEHLLPVIFRWKAELNVKVWRELDQDISSLFSKAITATPSRATFKITERENT